MNRTHFWEGLRGGFPVALASAPFGLLFGALAADQGMVLSQIILMSATIYAGASQLVGLELFGHQTHAWVIVLSVLAVNFRHVLYSAAIAPFVAHFSLLQKILAFFLLVDPQFAETLKRGENRQLVTFAWYLGFGIIIYLSWITVSVVGGLLGSYIGDPKAIGLDVLLPAYFLGFVIDFRHRDHFLPIALTSAAASIFAYHTVGSPWHVSLGALAGVLVGAGMPLQAKNNRTTELEEINDASV